MDECEALKSGTVNTVKWYPCLELEVRLVTEPVRGGGLHHIEQVLDADAEGAVLVVPLCAGPYPSPPLDSA